MTLYLILFYFLAIPNCEVPTEDVCASNPQEGYDICYYVKVPTIPQSHGTYSIQVATHTEIPTPTYECFKTVKRVMEAK